MADFTVTFWGTRGSIPCPYPDFMRYGGNTSCVEVRCGGQLLLLDGGTGIRSFSKTLCAQPREKLVLLLSHTHFDHVMGLPFFMPLYQPDWDIEVFAGHLLPTGSLKQTFQKMMISPFFPISPESFRANVRYTDFKAGGTLQPYPDVVIKTHALAHPDNATGYRIEYAGKSFCYITDIEHTAGHLDTALVEFLRGADAVVYDCTFTDADYPAHKGWGHSTWQEGLRLVQAAEAGRLIIFHHNPLYNDHTMAAIEAEAMALAPRTLVSYEGLRVSL